MRGEVFIFAFERARALLYRRHRQQPAQDEEQTDHHHGERSPNSQTPRPASAHERAGREPALGSSGPAEMTVPAASSRRGAMSWRSYTGARADGLPLWRSVFRRALREDFLDDLAMNVGEATVDGRCGAN